MKKVKLLSVLIAIFIAYVSCGQTDQFIWESGFNSRNLVPVFGTKGVSNSAHYPGGREDAVCWSDLQGNVWLFGGKNGTIASGNGNSMNDLWKYNPTTNEWTWMTGSNVPSSSGSYGSIGFSSATNNPPARYAAAAWTDNSGNLWLFGGIKDPPSGIAPLYNDLWKYNTTTNQWTWMGGSNLTNQVSAFGTMGTPDVSNIPGARSHCSYWKDLDGNLMLYGGSGYGSVVKGIINQLWKYDITTGEWTFINGVTGVNSLPTFGTQGIAAAANKPGSRYKCSGWKDNAGNVWIYGGYGYGQNPSVAPLNDMWKLDPITNHWTWFSGSSGTLPVAPIYGVTGVEAINNTPGTKTNQSSWKDTLGNLWLFGGHNNSAGFRCDLWKFNPTSGMWAYMNGSKITDAAGQYGTMGGPSFFPGSRINTAYCADKNGNFILYGGYGHDASGLQGTLADLWFYDTPEAPLPSITTFSSTTSCGTSAVLTINGNNLLNATVSIGATTITPLATNTNTQITVNVNSGTNGLITVTTTNGSSTSASSFSLNPLPIISVNSGSICSGSSFTINPTGANTYTISGGSAIVTPTSNTTYSITGTSSQGCLSSNTAISSVTVNAKPTISVNSGSICTGNSFTINPTGASTYTISGGSAIVSPTTNTSYNVTGTSLQGCVSLNTAVSSVTVNAKPTVSVNSGSICSGNSFTINPSGASTYTISGGSAIVSPTTNTSYNITGTSTQGCVSSNTAVSSVTVNSIPVISVNSGSICSGNSFAINPTGASTYTISGGSAIVSPTANTSYNVTGTSAQGCVSSNTAVSSVTVNANPVVSVNSGSICSGSSFTINPSGANTYTISGGSAIVSPTTNTSYNVTGTNAQGCVSSNTAISSVTVNTLPNVTAITNNTLLCTGQTASLTASGASTYLWNTSATTSVIAISPTITTNYTVSGTDVNGCSNSVVLTQSVSACTGIAFLNTKISNISIYPNPSNGVFTISGIEINTTISIYNAIGELVKSIQSSDNNTTIDLFDYSNGIYFIKIKNNKGESTQKLIKQ